MDEQQTPKTLSVREEIQHYGTLANLFEPLSDASRAKLVGWVNATYGAGETTVKAVGRPKKAA